MTRINSVLLAICFALIGNAHAERVAGVVPVATPTQGSSDQIVRLCHQRTGQIRYASANLQLRGYKPCEQQMETQALCDPSGKKVIGKFKSDEIPAAWKPCSLGPRIQITVHNDHSVTDERWEIDEEALNDPEAPAESTNAFEEAPQDIPTRSARRSRSPRSGGGGSGLSDYMDSLSSMLGPNPFGGDDKKRRRAEKKAQKLMKNKSFKKMANGIMQGKDINELMDMAQEMENPDEMRDQAMDLLDELPAEQQELLKSLIGGSVKDEMFRR